MASNLPQEETELEQDQANGTENMPDLMSNAELEQITWYHPNMTRHLSEGLLMHNGYDGSYLLRPSTKQGQLSLSIRCAKSVKHFVIGWDGHQYSFGMGKFDCLTEFIEHFENKPLIGSDSGSLTVLKYPYPRDIEEPPEYDTVRVHALFGKHRDENDRKGNSAIATHEGFLTKLGGRVKNWKTRYFVVTGTDLKYFKVKDDPLPLKTLDLTKCQEVSGDNTHGKANCFKIVMPERTFYCFATTNKEAEDWIQLLRWKMDSSKETKP